jgi:hypothetical protein
MLSIFLILLAALGPGAYLAADRNEYQKKKNYIKFEVFTAVTMKNGVFCDVTSYGSCKN